MNQSISTLTSSLEATGKEKISQTSYRDIAVFASPLALIFPAEYFRLFPLSSANVSHVQVQQGACNKSFRISNFIKWVPTYYCIKNTYLQYAIVCATK